MEYALMSFRNVFSAFFNFCSDIEVVEGVSIVGVLVAVFILGLLFKRYHI